MFRKTRRKIVAAVFFSLLAFLLVLLLTIYLASYRATEEKNREALQRFTENGRTEERADGGPIEVWDDDRRDEGRRGGPLRDEPPRLDLYNFYSVAFGEDGSVLSVDLGDDRFFTEDALVSLSRSILDSGKTDGKTDNLMYMVQSDGSKTLVALLDITVTDSSMNTLLRQMLIIGAAALLVISLISLFLARRIVKPLEEADRKQKEFISDAGHELKTPVSVISTNVDLLSRQSGGNEWLSNIQHENERMGTLITELLDLSRAESAEIPKERVDLSRLVRGEALPFESVAFERNLSLHCDVTDGIAVEGSADRLAQLVSILLDNAVEHADGGEISLSLLPEHHQAVLTVTNRGEEIPSEERERIFERFYRLDRVRNGESGHYGLGLAIARAIAYSHRGTLRVECGNGLVSFIAELPAIK